MYINIRRIGANIGENDLLLDISKKAKIQHLRGMINERLGISVDKQRLFYRGKQLIDDHCILEYNIVLNDVILLMVQAESIIKGQQVVPITCNVENAPQEEEKLEIDVESQYYKVGDYIDFRDTFGAWFEGILEKIIKKFRDATEEELIFVVRRQNELGRDPFKVSLSEVRPRSHRTYKVSELTEGMSVLVNYNMDEPGSRGYWYDVKVKQVEEKSIIGTVTLGGDQTPVDNCKVKIIDDIFKIEVPVLLKERVYDEVMLKNLLMRKIPYNCFRCKDIEARNCKKCGCAVCGGKNEWNKILLCDECDLGYHIGCLDPPLEVVPSVDYWYCPDCKNDENEIVRAGDKLKFSKKKAKMPSANENASTRDWGRGMACVGKTKECTIVGKDHVGPVPGVEVGTCWRYRTQVAEAGVHRLLVHGIHGRYNECAYSIVLAGGYEDDIDNGEDFYYTGSGGRDLSGNKRLNVQSYDQVLTKMNRALALNCKAEINMNNGAEAVDWTSGVPVRVVRSYKLRKYSKYAPEVGYRYDGIYKVVRYYPEVGKSGFVVWRYFLRRDDPSPAPWHKLGKELDVIYPPGYMEAQALKENHVETAEDKVAQRQGTKRKANTLHVFLKSSKKSKLEEYKLEDHILDKIKSDTANEKLWGECMPAMEEGKVVFLKKVEESFMCVCCQEIVYKAITTVCGHNVCRPCLVRSFKADIFTCPNCRFNLGQGYKLTENENLNFTLMQLFPGYERGR